ncbi:sortase [Candidatus Daviesbacteria bacterium]|nr:sortase [Candidatus Daviesbacteria bacterium]
MRSYLLIKKYPKNSTIAQNNILTAKIVPLAVMMMGLMILIYVVWPLVVYEISYAPRFVSPELASPLQDTNSPAQVLSTQNKNLEFDNIINNVNQVVPQKDDLAKFLRPLPIVDGVESFVISIPKLKIGSAQVNVNAQTFDTALAHLPGSALPGERGNSVIVGHSALPQFFNSENYKTIFSTLPDLEIGDEIVATIAGTTYRYAVEKSEVVKPEQISALIPPSQDRYLTLLTCVPPGLRSDRLLVKASLVGFIREGNNL